MQRLHSYNIFIKDSFNTIYNRPNLGFLPEKIKNIVIKYKKKKADIVIVGLAKIWKDLNNQIIISKYKSLTSKYIYFTNDIYKNIVKKNDIFKKFFELYINIICSIIYILCFYNFLIICLIMNEKRKLYIIPTSTLKINYISKTIT